ncbi:hypothetical protein, partial [Azovibrio restrictus]|uniref:hypothetical protein n=1 Tax=Azovibrio restrictus TaxID=146938 RepID=UPI0026EFA10F
MKTTPPFIRCALTVALGLAFQAVQAADAGAAQVPGDGSVFTLGQITVTSHREDERPIGTDSLNRETLRDFDKDGLAEALNLVPGVTSTSG